MKLIVLLSLVALVACDYSASDSEAPTGAFATPEKSESSEINVGSSIQPGKSFFNYKNLYHGAFPPARFPPANFFSSTSFPSFTYPLKTFNYAASPQGILPPISQIIPPQISQIVPPISQVVPPIFGNAKPVLPALPALPIPSPAVPPQILSSAPKPLFNQFTYPYYSSSHHFSYFPSTFSFPSNNFFSTQTQKQPTKNQQESPSTSYGPPVSDPVEPEPAGPAESSAPFEPSPVSFPYEPAVPEVQEPAAPYKPAQEYGLPASK